MLCFPGYLIQAKKISEICFGLGLVIRTIVTNVSFADIAVFRHKAILGGDLKGLDANNCAETFAHDTKKLK